MDNKVERYIKDMEKRRIKNYLIVPPIFRLLWYCGVNVCPPIFNSFTSNAIVIGLFWTIVVGCIEYSYNLIFSAPPHKSQLLIAFFAGAATGVTEAWRIAKESKKHALPSWNDYISG